MGYKVSPNYYMFVMNKIFKSLIGHGVYCYMDGIIIYSDDFPSHLKLLQRIFQLLKQHNLKLKLSKCKWCLPKIAYVGHEISQRGIEPAKNKLQVISQIKPPHNLKALRQALGFFNFYRRFVYNFARIARPLTRLTRKNTEFIWSTECQNSFDTLKKNVCYYHLCHDITCVYVILQIYINYT